MNTLTKKFLSGMTGLAIAAPMTLGVAFAEEPEAFDDNNVPTQACVDARTAVDDSLIAAKNKQTTAEVAAIQAHKAALVAAAALTDMTAKKAAFKKAETDFRTAMKSAMEASRDSMKTSMDAVKSACGKAAMPGARMMENRDNGKKGFMKKMMKAFGHGKRRGNGNSSSSSSSAQ